MFKLSIECTKDIDSINIVFSDGKVASVAGEPSDRDSAVIRPMTSVPIAQGVVAKPNVPDTTQRQVNVADNLQNLDL